MGDIVDLLAMGKRVYFNHQHEEVLALIFRLARKGTKVIYIPGNHDALLRRFCGQTIGGFVSAFCGIKLDAISLT